MFTMKKIFLYGHLTPLSTSEECVCAMFLSAGVWRKQAAHKNLFLAKLYKTLVCTYVSKLDPCLSGFPVCVCCMSVHGFSPLTLIVAEVLIDWGFQLKEVLLHCSPDGSLNYPGKRTKTHQDFYVYSHNFDACITFDLKKEHLPHITV